jgi:hypothetical protein
VLALCEVQVISDHPAPFLGFSWTHTGCFPSLSGIAIPSNGTHAVRSIVVPGSQLAFGRVGGGWKMAR